MLKGKNKMEINWNELGFSYIKTDKRYVSNFKNGAWDDGCLTEDANITMSEYACEVQYAQTCFEELKAYQTVDGKTVTFRPDLNAERMIASCEKMKMPDFLN